MPDDRSRKLDLVALALLAVTIFLAVALFSFDPADPPGTSVYPPREEIHNACGPLGAFSARLLFGGFGLGAYFALASLGLVTGLMLARKDIDQPILRLSGWLVALVGVCTLAAMAGPGLAPGPVIGPGGYLGAAGLGLLETYFASAGAIILTLSLILGGLLLCSDYWVLRVAGWSAAASVGGVSRVKRALPGKHAQPHALASGKSASGKPALGTSKDDPTELRIKSPRAKRAAQAAEAEAKKADAKPADAKKLDVKQAEQAAAEAEAAEEASKPGLAGRVAEALKIKNRKNKKAEREALLAEIEAAASKDRAAEYELPPWDLLLDTEPFSYEEQEVEVRRKAEQLEQAFASFGYSVKVVEIETGPVVAQYEVELEAGLRLSKIINLADDLAVALRVPSVRVVAPIPGKNTVGVEVPNADRQLVRLREVMEESPAKVDKMAIPMYLGKDVSGNPMIVDLTTLPHLLIAGRTGTGKSVCLNTLIMSMMMTRRPDEVKMLLIDPKMVELTPYARLPHLMHPVVTDMKKAEAILAWAVEKMEERYALLMRAGVRHMASFNQLGEEELRERIQPESDEEWDEIPKHLPYIVIVADEMADLMMTAPKEVEAHIIRLAQKSRAVGIHLILATQKPTVDVITGLIKSNLPARISFQVASRTDSRVVLDEMGADKLLGNGDMLFLWPGTSTLLRGQGAYVSDDEIRDVVEFLATTEPQFVAELVELRPKPAEGGGKSAGSKDDLYDAAVEIVIGEGRGSVSLLQRSLGIGYGRAARLIDYMAEDGVVGAYNGSQAREVMLTLEDWRTSRGYNSDDGDEPAAAKPRRSNKLVLREPEPDDEDSDEDSDNDSDWEDDGERNEYDEDDSRSSRVSSRSARVSDPDDDAPFDADEEAEEHEELAIAGRRR